MEIATFERVNWWDDSTLHQSLGYRTPVEAESELWETTRLKKNGNQDSSLGTKPGALQLLGRTALAQQENPPAVPLEESRWVFTVLLRSLTGV